MLDLLRVLEGMVKNINVKRKYFKQQKISNIFGVNKIKNIYPIIF